MLNETDAFFEDRRFSENCFTHDLVKLVVLAGLNDALKAFVASGKPRSENWIIVKDWKETSRYNRWTEGEARALYAAVADTKDGVLAWVREQW